MRVFERVVRHIIICLDSEKLLNFIESFGFDITRMSFSEFCQLISAIEIYLIDISNTEHKTLLYKIEEFVNTAKRIHPSLSSKLPIVISLVFN